MTCATNSEENDGNLDFPDQEYYYTVIILVII